MSQTLANGIVVPTNPDNFANLTNDLATMGNSANVVIQVANQAARDALTKKTGLLVLRMDTGSVEYCDGTNWYAVAPQVPLGHMGRTAGFMALTTTPTVVGMSAGQILRGGVTYANNALTVPITGLYEIRIRAYASGSTAGQYVNAVYRNGTALSGAGIYIAKPDGQDYTSSAVVTTSLTAGDALTLYAWTGSTISGANTWGTDGYNGVSLEVKYAEA